MNNDDKFRAAVKKFDDTNKELVRLRLATVKAETALESVTDNLCRVVRAVFGRKHVVYGGRVFSVEKKPGPDQSKFTLLITSFTGAIVPTIPGEEPDATCGTSQYEEEEGQEEERGETDSSE